MLIARQLHQGGAMPFGKLDKIVRFGAGKTLKRGKSRPQARNQFLGVIELAITKPDPEFRTMQRGIFAAPLCCKLTAEAREIVRKPAGSGLRTRTAKQSQLKRLVGIPERAWGAA
jgi:hypothetical protein